MQVKELIIALPTDDRERAFEFYKALGFKLARNPELTDIPEPLELRLTSNAVLMIVPRDGFAYVTPGNTVAANGVSECVQSLILESASQVDALIEKAQAAGATILVPPSKQFMGYAGQFKDLDGHLWMIISL
ncbi:MAG TPA: VOC family protein [Candidatus Saccharimonadales bacterium]|nr:VOC family protein [Candidatus Saccharimonadales bacterium]